MLPARNDCAPSSSSPAVCFAPKPGTPHYPTSQNKSTLHQPGHEQTAVQQPTAKRRASPHTRRLLTALSQSLFTMRSSPHHFCSPGLFQQTDLEQSTYKVVAPALSSDHFPGIVLQLVDTLKQTACTMALYKAKQMEVDQVHCAQQEPQGKKREKKKKKSLICYLLFFPHRQTDRARHLKHRCLSHYRSPWGLPGLRLWFSRQRIPNRI